VKKWEKKSGQEGRRPISCHLLTLLVAVRELYSRMTKEELRKLGDVHEKNHGKRHIRSGPRNIGKITCTLHPPPLFSILGLAYFGVRLIL